MKYNYEFEAASERFKTSVIFCKEYLTPNDGFSEFAGLLYSDFTT